MAFKTRLTWLRAACGKLLPLLAAAGWPCPSPVRAFTWAGVDDCNAGEYWNRSPMAPAQVAISPDLDDPAEVLVTLLHELIHHVTGAGGHVGAFARAAQKIGLGRRRSWGKAEVDLSRQLRPILRALGPYPPT